MTYEEFLYNQKIYLISKVDKPIRYKLEKRHIDIEISKSKCDYETLSEGSFVQFELTDGSNISGNVANVRETELMWFIELEVN